MCVAAYACDTFESEVKKFRLKTRFLEEGDTEGSKTAVYVKRYLALYCELREGANVVDDSMWEIRCRAYKEDRVAVDKSRNTWDVNLIRGSRASD